LAAFLVGGRPLSMAGPIVSSPGVEPSLVHRDDVILFEGFETSDWHTAFSASERPRNTSLARTPVFGGNTSLRVHISRGQHYGTSFSFKFARHRLSDPEQIYLRYYVYFSDNWRMNGNGRQVGKLPGLAGVYGRGGFGGTPATGANGWSARGGSHAFDNYVRFFSYVYSVVPGTTYGTIHPWNAEMARQRWHCVEMFLKVNTISGGRGNKDGIIRGWINGRKVFEKSDYRFRDVPELKIEDIWFDVYVGGTWTAERDMDVYFDNLVVARNPIGLAGPHEAAPRAPRGLQIFTP
jgi:hypothetical protein